MCAVYTHTHIIIHTTVLKRVGDDTKSTFIVIEEKDEARTKVRVGECGIAEYMECAIRLI